MKAHALDCLAMATENRGIRIPSTLWIDQADAEDRLAERLDRSELSPSTADAVGQFIRDGYCVFDLGIDDELLDRMLARVEELWRDRPEDLAYAAGGPARRITHGDPERDRGPGCRIHDHYSHCRAAESLYLSPRLFEVVAALLGEKPVAIQSLFFEYGSQQALHRDEVVVPVAEPGHLLAAWIALEDISPESGALTYVPGSHRLPCFEVEPGEWRFDGRRIGPEVVREGLAWEEAQERRLGLEAEVFTPRRGQVLLWHGALRHGGSPVTDPTKTRKSFVIHYSSHRTYPTRGISLAEPVGGEDVWKVYETEEVLEAEGGVGFRNPVAGTAAP